MGRLVNKQELSEILGKSERTLTTWQKNGLPIALDGGRGAQNQYDTEAVIDWLINREISKLTIDDEGRIHDYEAERARLTHHQANKTALEEEVLKGSLLKAELVDRVWGDMISAFRAKMLSLPTKTAAQLINESDIAVIESVLREQVYEALTELSDYEPEQFGIQPDQEDADADHASAESHH